MFGIVLLQISLGITFFLTGLYILKDPNGWTKFIKPWAKDLLPIPKDQAMRLTGYYDLFQGLWLISSLFTPLAAFFATIHMIIVLIVAGIDQVTYRDIGILGASISLLLLSL